MVILRPACELWLSIPKSQQKDRFRRYLLYQLGEHLLKQGWPTLWVRGASLTMRPGALLAPELASRLEAGKLG